MVLENATDAELVELEQEDMTPAELQEREQEELAVKAVADKARETMPVGDDEEAAKLQAEDAAAEKTAEEVPGVKTEEPKPDQEEPKAPELELRLKHAAEYMGLTDEQVTAMGDQAEGILSKVADARDRISRGFSDLGKPPPAAKVDDKDDAEKPKPFDAKTPFDLKKLRFGEDGERVLSDEADAMIQEQQRQLNQLREHTVALADRLERAEQDVVQKEFDAMEDFFVGITEQYGDVYGKGSSLEMAEDSPELQARMTLWNEANAIYEGRRARGMKTNREDCRKDALSLLQADRIKETARKELEEKVVKRSKQVSAKPRSRKPAAPVKGEQAAVDAVKQKITEMGILG